MSPYGISDRYAWVHAGERMNLVPYFMPFFCFPSPAAARALYSIDGLTAFDVCKRSMSIAASKFKDQTLHTGRKSTSVTLGSPTGSGVYTYGYTNVRRLQCVHYGSCFPGMCCHTNDRIIFEVLKNEAPPPATSTAPLASQENPKVVSVTEGKDDKGVSTTD